jgi:CRISPR-associated protein Cmr5
MRKQISENEIEKAIQAIKDSGIAKGANKLEVPSEFKGYISSFGAAVIQSGILPALIFFEDKGSAMEDRTKLLKAIMLMKCWAGKDDNNISLVEYYKNMPTGEKDLAESQILQSAIAIKLALRTFKFK